VLARVHSWIHELHRPIHDRTEICGAGHIDLGQTFQPASSSGSQRDHRYPQFRKDRSLIFEGQLKTRHAPGKSFEPYLIPVLASPKRVLAAFERLRSKIRTYPDAQRAHIGTKDALNNEVKLAFGQGDLSWKPGHLRSAYGAICCHRFKPKNMTDDIRDPRPQTLAGRPSAVRWFNISDPPGDLVILTMRISRLELWPSLLLRSSQSIEMASRKFVAPAACSTPSDETLDGVANGVVPKQIS
jgi:hypothetical protein